MCILCGGCVDMFKCTLDFVTKSVRLVSKLFIDGMGVMALALATKDHKWGYGPSSCCDALDKQLLFHSSPIKWSWSNFYVR